MQYSTLLSRSKLLKLLILNLVLIPVLKADNYWQVVSIDSIKGGNTYCQTEPVNPIQLFISQCPGGSSQPDYSTTFRITWYRNSINSNTGGTSVAVLNLSTTYQTNRLIQYTPNSDSSGIYYYYAVISNPSRTDCGFSGSIKSQTVEMEYLKRDDPSFSYDSSFMCSSEGVIFPTITGLKGGTFSSLAENGVHGTTGRINCDSIAPGIVIVNYTTKGYCPNSSADTIQIAESPITNVVVDGVFITASDTDATYRWFHCDTGLVEIQNQTGRIFTATKNGKYTVELSKNGCIEFSDCVEITELSLITIKPLNVITVYPNPSSGIVTLAGELETKVDIYTIEMKWIETVRSDVNGQIDISHLAAGTYYLKVNEGTMAIVVKSEF